MLAGCGFFIARAAERFIRIGFTQQDTFVRRYKAVAHIRQITTMDTNGVGLIYIVGNRHKGRHWPEGYAFEIHIQTCNNHTYAARC